MTRNPSIHRLFCSLIVCTALLGLPLAGCGSSQEESAGPEATPSSPEGEGVSAEGAATQEPASAGSGSQEDQAEAAPAVTAAAFRERCAEGAEALDEEAYAASNAAVQRGDFAAALTALRAIAEAHPRASEVEVWIADAALKTSPPDPAAALAALDRADAMIEAGCALPGAREDWVRTGSRGIALLMRREPAAARPILERATERWPESPNFHYNLACVRCLERDVDGCHQELTQALASAATRRQEQTLGFRDHSPEQYAQLSRNDPDLALLRADPRYETLLASYSGQGSEGEHAAPDEEDEEDEEEED